MCLMKILSYNVRGLGGHEKQREVLCVVHDKKPSILYVQETKLTVIDDYLCSSLWGHIPCDYSYQPSVGAFGGY